VSTSPPGKWAKSREPVFVTGVTGQVIIVRWSSGEESRLVPGPGALTVVGRGTVTPRANKKANAAPQKADPAKKKAGRKR